MNKNQTFLYIPDTVHVHPLLEVYMYMSVHRIHSNDLSLALECGEYSRNRVAEKSTGARRQTVNEDCNFLFLFLLRILRIQKSEKGNRGD